MANYYCEYCGQKFASVQVLVANGCAKHPNGFSKGNHKIYEGSEKSKYTCKYCGQTFNSIQSMVGVTCARHPSGFGKGAHALALQDIGG